ncbi:phosphatase PAP2 family protein [Streptomyces sp. NPDC047981]|uniref:phosphatase PAP2 family protein n=1 Tax=Streptomyces sp. NPDC047981 TaxID=3154610 RepID=UPI0034433B09
MAGTPTQTPLTPPARPTPATSRRRPSPTARRSGPLALGVLFLLVTAVLAATVSARPEHPLTQPLDDTWLRWMGGPHDGPYAAVAAVLDWFGGPLGVVVPLGLLVFLAVRRRWPSLFCLLTAYLVGGFLVVQALKHGVDRPRPADPLVRVDHGSFPSGHVAGTALLVVIAVALLVPAGRRRGWWAAGAVLTLAMMWSRTWLHAHWLSDTVAGAATGAGMALVVWWAFTPLLNREESARGRDAQAP